MFGKGPCLLKAHNSALVTPPDELEASPAGSRSDDYSLAFLWFSVPPPPNFELFWSAAAAAAGLGCLSRRVCAVKPNNVRSQCFRALPASENSPPFTGVLLLS